MRRVGTNSHSRCNCREYPAQATLISVSMSTCSCTPDSKLSPRQEFPTEGALFTNTGFSRSQLQSKLGGFGKEDVYAYVLTTLKLDDEGHFVQEGSAPNIEGGWITLCTCKHFMRTLRRPDEWPGTWVAGFDGCSQNQGEGNALFYLIRVQTAFQSQKALWEKGPLPANVKAIKCASNNPLGDLYERRGGASWEFSPGSYRRPMLGHSHRKSSKSEQWRNDIAYESRSKRPALLVGAPRLSFLWSRPMLHLDSQLPRNCRKLSLHELLDLLS